ncbi:MAG: O-antigen ligase family protein, partial [Clostridia bacterium]|nr:O-antigen ligase family protein [Clostridia bacterium]
AGDAWGTAKPTLGRKPAEYRLAGARCDAPTGSFSRDPRIRATRAPTTPTSVSLRKLRYAIDENGKKCYNKRERAADSAPAQKRRAAVETNAAEGRVSAFGGSGRTGGGIMDYAQRDWRQVFGEKFAQWLLNACYIVLMTLNFLGELRGFPRMLKGAGMVVVAIALVHFIITFDRERARYQGEYFAIITIPVILVLTASLLIWIINLSPLSEITNGVSKLLVQSINIFVVIATLYLYRRDGLRYTLYGMSIAYFIIIIKAFGVYGPSAFLSSFIYFVTSLGDASGAMRYLEVHDLTFAFGFFVIYYMLAPKDEPKRRLGLTLALAGFLLGYKRIAMMSVALAIVYNFYINRVKPEKQRKSIMRFGVFMLIFSFAYLYIIRYGIFDWFTETFNIDTMSRTGLYHFISDYYEITPNFVGYGIDYVYYLLTDLKDAGIDGISGITAIHNDLLRQFIEIGFWGYLAWTLYELVIHPKWLMDRHGFNSAKVYVLMTIYIYFTYLTDNTMYYYHSAFIYRLIPLACAQTYQDQADAAARNVLKGAGDVAL